MCLAQLLSSDVNKCKGDRIDTNSKTNVTGNESQIHKMMPRTEATWSKRQQQDYILKILLIWQKGRSEE